MGTIVKREDMTALDMVMELILLAQRRMKIELPTPEEARKEAVDELILARDMLDAIIKDY